MRETEKGGRTEIRKAKEGRFRTELQQVCGGEVTVSEAETPAVRFLPQPLQEEANSAPAEVSGAVCGLGSSWNTNDHL